MRTSPTIMLLGTWSWMVAIVTTAGLPAGRILVNAQATAGGGSNKSSTYLRSLPEPTEKESKIREELRNALDESLVLFESHQEVSLKLKQSIQEMLIAVTRQDEDALFLELEGILKALQEEFVELRKDMKDSDGYNDPNNAEVVAALDSTILQLSTVELESLQRPSTDSRVLEENKQERDNDHDTDDAETAEEIIDSSEEDDDDEQAQDGQEDQDQDPHQRHHEHIKAYRRKLRDLKNSNPGLHQFAEYAEAALNGNSHTLHRHHSAFQRRAHGTTGGGYSRTSAFHHGHGRRMNTATTIPKEEMCTTLVGCVQSMSLFDLFVYFYSDHIDPNTGEFNVTNAKFFDEGGQLKVRNKYSTIQDLATSIASSYDGQKCDDLLTQFHRTVKGVDKETSPFVVEPATIGTVCFAAETLQYVNLANVTAQGLGDVTKDIIHDYLKCSYDIHMNPNNKNVDLEGSQFNFHFKKLDFPSEFKTAARDEHGELLSSGVDPWAFFNYYQELVVESVTNTITNRGRISLTQDCQEELENYYFNEYMEKGIVDSNLEQLCPMTTDSSGNIVQYCTISYLSGGNFDGKCTDMDVQPCDDECQLPSFPRWYHEGTDSFGNTLTVSTTEKIEKSLALVLGDQVSAGFVCGIRTANVRDGKEMPGTCCLDTPRDSVYGVGAQWGQPFSCDNRDECRHTAPALQQLSEEACNIWSGKFCQNTPDCTELVQCVQDMTVDATFPNGTARPGQQFFLEYLTLSPNITGPEKCGPAREYFGFEDTFSNDRFICESIKQQKYSQDFAKFESFFGGGSQPVITSQTCPGEMLISPTNDTLISAAGSTAWSITNFALEKVLQIINGAIEIWDPFECNCSASGEGCKRPKMIAKIALNIVLKAVDIGLKISKFTKSELADVSEPQDQKRSAKVHSIYPNMVGLINKINNEADEIDNRIRRGFNIAIDAEGNEYYEDAVTSCQVFHEVDCRPVENFARGQGCDGINSNCDTDYLIDECAEDKFPPDIDFDAVTEHCGPDKHVFSSLAAAEACVSKFVSVSDDCYDIVKPIVFTNATAPAISDCGSYHNITVEAREEICGKTYSDSFIVNVIEYLEFGQESCELPNGPDTLPLLNIEDAIAYCSGDKFWNTVADAEDCVKRYVTVSDPCRKVEKIVLVDEDASLAVEGCDLLGSSYHNVQLRAEIKGCPDKLFVEESFDVLVDSTIGQKSCDFSLGPDMDPLLDTTDAFALCDGKLFPDEDAAKNCLLQFTKSEDVSGKCRPTTTTASSLINEELSLPGCGTQMIDVVVDTTIDGCSGLFKQENFSMVVDDLLLSDSCLFGQGGPYRNPIVESSKAFEHCHEQIFATLEEATHCVLQFTTAQDASEGCRPYTVVANPPVETSTCTWEITVTASIDRCDPLTTVSEPIVVIVDNEPPELFCEHEAPVEITGAGVYSDPQLVYTVRDNCPLFPLTVEVESLSNEWETGPIAYLYNFKNASSAIPENPKYGVKMASNVCSTISSGVCISPTANKGIRTYTSRINAVDHAGFRTTTECFVDIVPNGGGSTSEVEVIPKGQQKKKEETEAPSSTVTETEEAPVEIMMTSFLIASSGPVSYMSDPLNLE